MCGHDGILSYYSHLSLMSFTLSLILSHLTYDALRAVILYQLQCAVDYERMKQIGMNNGATR